MLFGRGAGRWTAPLLICAFLGFAEQPESVDAVVQSATHQIQNGNFRAAAGLLRESLKKFPADPTLWNLLGISATELHDKAAAIDAFEHGLKLAPKSPELYENLGLFYYRDADYPSAKKYLSKAVALGSDKPSVAFSLDAAKIRTGEPESGLADLIRLEPSLGNVADYWDERGWVEIHRDSRAADSSFEHVLLIAPEDLRALNGAAAVAEVQKNDEKALSFLIRAKQAHPDDVDTLMHFGAVCIRRDLTVDALQALEQAHKLDPSNNGALYLYARSEIGLQHWQQAYDLFSEFARRVPKFAPTYYALGWLDLKMNRTAEARKELGRCLALEPNYADSRYELGQLDLNEGNLDAAEKELLTAVKQNPHHAKANVALGDLMLRKGNLADAESYYRAAIAAEPSSGAAHYKLSVVLSRLKRSEEAGKERLLGIQLQAKEHENSRVLMELATPDGTPLSAAP
ncbi:MAG: tetratricopeptide repeat protein [Bryobacteraceae bacterium]